MPELAEAETIRRQLIPYTRDKIINEVKLGRETMLRHPAPDEFLKQLPGRRVERVIRRGKAVIFILDNDSSLIIRLGMSGKITPVHKDDPADRHVALTLGFAGEDYEVRFRDPRRFGSITLRKGTDVDAFPEFAHYGPEPLSKAFNAEYVARVLKGRRQKLGVILMDQRYFVGVGKIYADEIAFRAGISPLREAGSLTPAEIELLVEKTKETLKEAIKRRGTTAGDRSYRDAHNKPGSFQPSTYFRTGEPCLRCGHPIIRTNLTGGRGMHWCPNCQK